MAARIARCFMLLPLVTMLAGCDWVVLRPAGDIALQQRDLIVVSTILMLLIVLPVMALTGIFAWRYRQSNREATYDPEWHHSTQLELVIWSAPLLIIIALGAVTWIATHTLDPYRKLSRLDAARPLPAEVRPLKVQVVALDWKWLFIYPDYGIASVNEMAAPVDVPIAFQITASSVMNSFFVPALAGQIYAMPGMETQLHAVINKAGDYEGFSANYSGHGFSHMRFRFAGMDGAAFDAWVAKVRASEGTLSREEYLRLEQPSERQPVRHYGASTAGLFDAIVNLCVDPTKMCMRDMMAIDARGGLGKAGIYNVAHLAYDRSRSRLDRSQDEAYVLSLCSIAPETMASPAPDAPQYGSVR
ncbi:ubiquinol oxidase subunit II [Solimonas sp. K1W22B-7]|uniref:ubiquinol oxidase subunit II n=1 Tax=Solimonas sp. K1W22B-7 TaxID=2303331 RepID=UPI000E32DF41|nr:ubiquinol oxidase subunit II [Solimonas sp. K1W22B-7]AXQ31377.1 ubiquinol oxidase subunit II [Solimonas sp. K1W22B-7]